ncbi:hypothetical protein, conserved, containing leucine zipper motif [Thermococcus kodakarensis KOD1]|uniref:Uncharacterized protein n=1 Tax=Thermococcus kodakarensis (strain ATCC BAA-918 / JCM 12380 / KOD1) TaxID=69014 RepID=Q5JD62_THEKO|nr:hypothetical protein [Thermococcus kodakarensis]WCN29183.1 hypothetical protein POG15_02440 [Thermococcus kodakarensis]WCN31487.1 hypothetical protein POG21_02440 [Thermococcus kodakarensis]BAD84665.1 hypothetical protein, conserved, containing leucine zipper motif [Thermococcus kodakarensis KOD1]
MFSFTHIFAGIGSNGSRIVNGIETDSVVKVSLNPARYILRPKEYRERIVNFFSNVPENSFVWLVFDDTKTNREIMEIILEALPSDSIRLAYVLTPKVELINQKPEWADKFETVFYDSLWDFLKEDVPLGKAFEEASKNISDMFSKLYRYLESEMLVNIDYADLFSMIRGGNVGIMRLLREVDFSWHWGIWERGLVGILVGEDFPLSGAHRILSKFQEILSEKDIIWGVITDKNVKGSEVLALLVKRW